MKKLVLGLGLSMGIISTLSASVIEATIAKEADEMIVSQENNGLDDLLKDASSGSVSSRFRGGYYFAGGYQHTVDAEEDSRVKISSFIVEGGVYGLFNPIRNFFDVEVGLNGKYNIGSKNDDEPHSAEKVYNPGLLQATAYSGLVFRFSGGKSALSLGVSKALYLKEIQTKEMEDANVEENDIENGLGAYIEYQYMGEKTGTIGFTRIEVERFDIKSNLKDESETVGSLLFGLKF